MGSPDMCQALDCMARRGLTMSAVTETAAEAAENEEHVYRRGSSCMYLRPVSAQESPLAELHERVSRLATQCRCGACFDCLGRAGCLS